MSTLATPHLEKIKAAMANEKLPATDGKTLQLVLERYASWMKNIQEAKSDMNPESRLNRLMADLNAYKFFIEFDVIFSSKDDFLYRQKGQLKLDNSIIEEFLPHLIDPILLPGINLDDMVIGPTTTFASVYFESTFSSAASDGGLRIRTKDQDFSIARKLYLQSSFDPTFPSSVPKTTFLSYVAAECKTNLDKTMFQEASATAHDIKAAIPGAKYFLLCEWLDMTPISTAPTDIDEVLILRKAKRLSSSRRKEFDTNKGRTQNAAFFSDFLKSNPVSTDTIKRFLTHIRKVVENESLVEDDVLSKGYF